MPTRTVVLDRLQAPVSDADVRELARLLRDAVASNAAVSFVLPFTQQDAEAWWRKTLAQAHPRTVVLVVREGDGLVGTVTLQPAWAPNQPHRAEIVKLLVDERRRRRGLATRLMQAAEDAARADGRTLLTLDARAGGEADRLYRRLGWTHLGDIPDYAVDADGRARHAASFFYKPLGPA